MTDQNGTAHDYLFDKLGRRTADVVTAFGSDIDGLVYRIGWAYDSRGLLASVTEYSDVGGTTILNQVTYAYNNFSQLITESQSHAGAVT